MKSIGKHNIKDALISLGLSKGDNVFVQSALATIGRIEGNLNSVRDAFLEVIGEEGTLCVPAFNFDFCNKGVFDVDNSPAQTSVFDEFIRKEQRAKRSIHPPMHSVTAIGRLASDLANCYSKSSFSDTSVFAFMLQHNFKICMFGTTLKHNTYFHYCEEQAEVPYRFFKRFKGKIIYNGEEKEAEYSYFARYSKPLLKADFHSAGEYLISLINGKKLVLGYGYVYLVDSVDLIQATLQELRKDPFFLLPKEQREIARECREWQE